jgi:hypothetical protein
MYSLINIDEKGSPATNMCLAQCRVKWLIKHSTSHQLSRCIYSFVLRNPSEHKALNFYNLTAGRYVGVAPQIDEGFDYEERMER